MSNRLSIGIDLRYQRTNRSPSLRNDLPTRSVGRSGKMTECQCPIHDRKAMAFGRRKL